MEWLLVLALNYSDGGSEVKHVHVPTKEACVIVLEASLAAASQAATAPFLWRSACVDLKNAKVDNSGIEVAPPRFTPKAAPDAPQANPDFIS